MSLFTMSTSKIDMGCNEDLCHRERASNAVSQSSLNGCHQHYFVHVMWFGFSYAGRVVIWSRLTSISIMRWSVQYARVMVMWDRLGYNIYDLSLLQFGVVDSVIKIHLCYNRFYFYYDSGLGRYQYKCNYKYKTLDIASKKCFLFLSKLMFCFYYDCQSVRFLYKIT